ncbi:ferritin-like domain-containing protein [Acidiluteibacter ferrifornacis]|uniref:PA2169 family four-helix-bundle protein n=1 Tax=Acidiluteibacter ferrifornacis TaxID=2692424 RepID=A0A6N9NNL5_9FLAO|nr:PA2169 family four-helix-bundle protein [Acidiluteibacter ferrifornacis]NBG67452.1 PA2169 family four-helix-bundle protein [Acidiluteibacter ferrifornacis]
METIKTLNNLLSRNYDAEKGFQLVAEKTKNPVLKNYFEKNSRMHNKFGHELKQEITHLGGKIDKGTSIEGDLHRGWLSVKAAVAGNTDEALIEECERGQTTALEDYQSAVNELKSNPLSSKLATHKAEIVDVVNELKTLELTA